MKYVYVEDGQIKEGPKALPANWRNVSGLNIDPAYAKALGWLPVQVIKPTITGAQRRGVKTTTITDDLVTISCTVVDLTGEDLDRYNNGLVQKEIKRLENLETPRRMREAAADTAGGSTAGRTWLKNNGIAIAAERAKLVDIPEPDMEV